MYIFTLVDDIGGAIEKLRKERGEFALAMLYNNVLEAETSWNLIVSAAWTNEMGVAEATRLIAQVLNESLGQENQRAVSRITVLKTSDPFVRDMVRLYAVKPASPMALPQVTAGDVTEGGGYILYSQKVA